MTCLFSLFPPGTVLQPFFVFHYTDIYISPVQLHCRMSLRLGLSDVSSLDSGCAHWWECHRKGCCSFPGHPMRRHVVSVCPTAADAHFDHLIKGVSVRFLHFYKVTDFPFLINKIAFDTLRLCKSSSNFYPQGTVDIWM